MIIGVKIRMKPKIMNTSQPKESLKVYVFTVRWSALYQAKYLCVADTIEKGLLASLSTFTTVLSLRVLLNCCCITFQDAWWNIRVLKLTGTTNNWIEILMAVFQTVCIALHRPFKMLVWTVCAALHQTIWNAGLNCPCRSLSDHSKCWFELSVPLFTRPFEMLVWTVCAALVWTSCAALTRPF